MEGKELTKEQSAIISKAERYIKRFEKFEIRQQQPWRKFNVEDNKNPRDTINKLNELIDNVRNGKFEKSKVELELNEINVNASVISVTLQYQNLQKSQKQEVSPFADISLEGILESTMAQIRVS